LNKSQTCVEHLIISQTRTEHLIISQTRTEHLIISQTRIKHLIISQTGTEHLIISQTCFKHLIISQTSLPVVFNICSVQKIWHVNSTQTLINICIRKVTAILKYCLVIKMLRVFLFYIITVVKVL